MERFRYPRHRAGNVPALAHDTTAVFVLVLHEVVIEDLAVIRAVTDQTSTLAMRSDRVPAHDPVADVDVAEGLRDYGIVA